MESLIEVDPLVEFFDAIKNPITKQKYTGRLTLFFDKVGLEGSLNDRAKQFVKRAKSDPQWATYQLNEYMRVQKARAESKEISESTLPNYYKPIKLFCEENDIILNWKKISRRIPKGRSFANDRAPTLLEIKKILGYPDRRIKPAVLFMLSSGCRVGAFDYLDFGHIEPITKKGVLLAAKVTIYAGTNEQYFSFITPEAYNAIQEYIEYRRSHGERISKDSPAIRDLFTPDKLGKGEPHLPKRLQSLGVKRVIEDALKSTGLRAPLAKGKHRYEFQADHGFRKYFKSVCERKMKSLHVEMLLGHTTGLANNYYRPQESELLEEYSKSIPDLTILESRPQSPTEDVETLKATVVELTKALKSVDRRLEALETK